MNATQIAELFARLQAARPQPTTELDYHSPFELLVAVILSAQSTDKKVNEATARLFQVANTPQALLELGEERLMIFKNLIRYTSGRFHPRQRNRPCRAASLC